MIDLMYMFILSQDNKLTNDENELWQLDQSHEDIFCAMIAYH